MSKIVLVLNDQGGGIMTWNYDETVNTLRGQMKHHEPIVVIDMEFSFQGFGQYKESDVSSFLKQRDYKDATDIIVNGDRDMNMVRRLTPEECELLQGFPKNWTNIGEWTDTLGKVHKESSDSSRYKALGNSIALPYWKVLARRISAQYDRDITMASLFDGIGGFPLAFEHCGGKAVWASEIEEFPIAVTKRHFPEESEVVTVDSGTEAAT